MSRKKEGNKKDCCALLVGAMYAPPALGPIRVETNQNTENQKISKKYRSSSPPETPIRGVNGEEEEG